MKESQIENLREVKRLLDEQGIFFYLDGGALLCSYRDGDFCDDDIDDIDIVAFYKDIGKMENIKGFRKVGDNFIRKVEGKVELYFAKETQTHYYLKIFNYFILYNKNFLRDFEEFEFHGMKLNRPKEIECYLTNMYGDWRKKLTRQQMNQQRNEMGHPLKQSYEPK